MSPEEYNGSLEPRTNRGLGWHCHVWTLLRMQGVLVDNSVWQHINLHGRYEFTKDSDPLDMQELIQAFAQRAAKRFQVG